MAQPALSRVVDTLRASARSKPDPAVPDRDLLARFARDRDADAFRGLVARHGATVLAACRQVLTDPADVDDAFQATFVVLLKRAKRLDPAAPLGGWLFGVAHRVAVRCRADARRRKAREAEAAKRARRTIDPPDPSWRDMAAALHAELDALPDKYRLPLLLCCVRGLTRDEAADEIGTTVGAVRGQLERGRSLLERRLLKRGVTLSAGLLAATMGGSRAAGGPPVELIDLTVRAAEGASSPAVAALAKGAYPMSMTAKHTLLPALAVLGLVGAGLGSGPGRPAAADDKPAMKADKPAAAATADPAKRETPERVVTGKVVAADGTPLQAELFLARVDGNAPAGRLGPTAPDGTFKVTVPLKDPGAFLIAKADGHGVEFMMPATNTPADVLFKLPKDQPVRGRVVDTQGRPVAGAAVSLTSLAAYDNGSADRYVDRWLESQVRRNIPLPDGDRVMWFHRPSAGRDRQPVLGATTDADGRFTLTGLGTERLAGLTVRGPGIADTSVGVFTRPGFDAKAVNAAVAAAGANERRMGLSVNTRTLFGPDPVVVAEREKVVRGTVTDPAGKPRAGVRVSFTRPNRSDLVAEPVSAVTGPDGRYEIRGARKHPGYMVEVDQDPAAGLLPRQGFADDTVGYEPVTIDLRCARGVVVTGTVREKATGKPVPGVVSADVLANNPYAAGYPPFTHSASGTSDKNVVGPDGRFRVVTVPGPVLLSVGPDSWDGRAVYKKVKPDPKHPDLFHTKFGALGYYGPDGSMGMVNGSWCKVLDAKPTDAEVTVDVGLERAATTAVRVVDAAGKPVTGVYATGVTNLPYVYPVPHPGTDVLAVAEVEGERLVCAAHPARRLVGTLTLKPGDTDPVLTLGPGGTAAGRVVGEDGKPLAGVAVQLHYRQLAVAEAAKILGGPEAAAVREQPPTVTVTTDAAGAFRFDAVFPGAEFKLQFRQGSKRLGPDDQKASTHTLTKPGEVLDLGTLMLSRTPADGEK